MGVSPSAGFGIMFTIVPVIIVIVFILVFGMIIIRSVQGAKQWNKNNQSPVLTVTATVVTKRTDVNQYQNNTGVNDTYQTSTSTTYYTTFEVASGDRMEFKVPDAEYGMLVEKDMGMLTFQGTRYLGFVRNSRQ